MISEKINQFNNVEELRPRIKPKAPAALKENVLKAVSQHSQPDSRQPQRGRHAMTWRIALSAAAVLLVGILTFALCGVHDADESATRLAATTPQQPPVATADAATRVAKKAPLSASSARVAPKPRIKAVSSPCLPTASAAHHTEVIEAEPLVATADIAHEQAEPSQESLTSTPPLSEEERQLIANFEAHRDFVNAYLAEELAQVRFMQQRLGQSTRQYLQQYREVQQRITEQLREDIDNIAPKEQSAEEV